MPAMSRMLRILWTSHICNTSGSTTSITYVTLRVRVGLVTRTEDIQLKTAWAISGRPRRHPRRRAGENAAPRPVMAKASQSRCGT
jgi:hypothetical protein